MPKFTVDKVMKSYERMRNLIFIDNFRQNGKTLENFSAKTEKL